MSNPRSDGPPFYCDVTGCVQSFTRRYDCYRHKDEVHGAMKKCPIHGCNWEGAKRKGRLHAHMKKDHEEHVPVELTVPNDLDRWSSQQVATPAYENGEAAPVQYSNTPSMPSMYNNQSTHATTSTYASPYQRHPPMTMPEGYTGRNYSTSEPGTVVEGQVENYNNGSNGEDIVGEIDNQQSQQNYYWTP